VSIVVDPANARLISYDGGRGGEFIAHLLNSHQECVNSYAVSAPKNRYIMRFNEEIEFAPTNNPQQVFVFSHDLEHKLIPGENVIRAYNSPQYHLYYFLLLCLKTRSQRFYFGGPVWSSFLTHQQSIELTQSMPGREWYYEHEAEAWLNNVTADDLRTSIVKFLEKHGPGSFFSRKKIKHKIIDLDQLYFGDTAEEYARICNEWKLTPIPTAVDTIRKYHAKNIALAEQYLGHDVNGLLNADESIAFDLVFDAVDRRHNDPED
jgi:hypothetical protein